MEFSGSHCLPASRNIVWELLNDPEVLARTTPGVSELIPNGDDSYKAVMNIKMGPINSRFEGSMNVVDKLANESFRLLIDVDARIGLVAAEGTIALVPAGDNETRVDFDGKARLSGKMAAMGQRVLIGVARMYTKRFFTALEQEISNQPA